jgi:DedD protein
MPLPSFLQRFSQGRTPSPVSDVMPLSQADMDATRVMARRRLVGMVVLVGAGVIGLPWLFETQPRPLSADVQIVQAGSAVRGDTTQTVLGASHPSASGKVALAGIVEPRQVAQRDEAPSTDAKEEIVEDAPAAAPKPVAHTPPVKEKSRVTEAKPVVKLPEKAAEKAVEAKPAPVKVAEKVLDKPSARYIVQIGAFVEPTLAHEARLKVERLGIKTYTQVADTPGGKKIRVRIGPYADKVEADKAMATLHKAGLSGNLLTL